MIEGVFCLRTKSWNFFVSVGRTPASRDSRCDDCGARLARSEERASYLRLEVGEEESVSAKVRELVGPPLWG